MNKLALIFTVVLLQGCAMPGPIQIEKKEVPIAGQQSLIIGASLDQHNYVYIDGKQYDISPGDRFRGLYTYAIELPPGQHTLTAVKSGDPNYSSTYYPIGRSFQTEPGEILSLGTLLIQKISEKSGNFVHTWVPNHKDVANALSPLAPQWLANDLTQNSFVAADGQYVTAKTLRDLLVMRAEPYGGLTDPSRIPAGAPIGFEGQALGSVMMHAWVEEDGKMVTKDFLLFLTDNTTNYFEKCSGAMTEVMCVTVDTTKLDRSGFPLDGESPRTLRLIDVGTGQTSHVADIPFIGHGRSLLWHDDLIIAVDEDFGVHTTNDQGNTWQSLATGVEREFLELVLRGVTYEAKNGNILVHLSGSNSGTVEIDASTGEPTLARLTE